MISAIDLKGIDTSFPDVNVNNRPIHKKSFIPRCLYFFQRVFHLCVLLCTCIRSIGVPIKVNQLALTGPINTYAKINTMQISAFYFLFLHCHSKLISFAVKQSRPIDHQAPTK